jgi:PTS system nitrogen regulatory IIA component
MALKDFLSPADVVLDMRVADKAQALLAMARHIAGHADVDANEVYEAILQREALGSTGMGDGIALPHARFAGVRQPVGVFVRLKQPVDFGAIDEQPVDLVFMILLPTTPQGGQLNALACAARALREAEVRAALRKAASVDSAYQLLLVPNPTSLTQDHSSRD